MEVSRLTQDGTAEPVSRYQILWRERGQGNIHFQLTTYLVVYIASSKAGVFSTEYYLEGLD